MHACTRHKHSLQLRSKGFRVETGSRNRPVRRNRSGIGLQTRLRFWLQNTTLPALPFRPPFLNRCCRSNQFLGLRRSPPWMEVRALQCKPGSVICVLCHLDYKLAVVFKEGVTLCHPWCWTIHYFKRQTALRSPGNLFQRVPCPSSDCAAQRREGGRSPISGSILR